MPISNPMKVTITMSLGRQTWSETHYSKIYADPTSDAAQQAALKLMQLRLQLCGLGVAVTGLRLARSDIPRAVVNPSLVGVETQVGFAQAGNEPDDADIPNVCATLRCDDGLGHAKSLYLAGIPDGCVNVTGTQPQYFYFNGGVATAFTQYRNELRANWMFRVKAPGAPANIFTLVPITVPFTCVGIQTATPIPGAPAAAPFPINITGCRRVSTRFPNLTGIYDCIAVSTSSVPPGQTVYALGETGNVQIGNFLKLGQAATVGHTYANYVDVNVVKSGTRRRGGRIGLPLGRSRGRN